MRFVRLAVEHFRAIERAEVEFGPGLNVLHGPNDLGKSTLAASIRAALLLPVTSSEAETHVPWIGDFTPSVTLTFADAGGRYWRVSKAFGGSRGSAVLESSKDGRDFINEAKGREVDERLRTMLEWGTPPAGSKLARGLPETFLSHVLLAAQTDVDGILRESLEADTGDSGRLRLTRALQAFARDPRFKKLLDDAEAECDLHFSATGKLKRGKNSPLTKVAEEARKLRAELDELAGQLQSTDEAEGRLKTLRDDVERLADDHAQAGEAWRRAAARVEARRALEAAQAETSGIDAALALVTAKDLEIAGLSLAAARAEEEHALAAGAEGKARAELENARAAHLSATNQKAASQRALKRSELERELSGVDNARLGVSARKREADQALEVEKGLAALETQREELDAKANAVRARRDTASRALDETGATREQLRNLLAYGRWKQASDALAAMGTAQRSARELASEAAKARARAAEVRAAVSDRALPDADAVAAVVALQRELELAEAALGGGLSVTVTPAKGVVVEVRADEGAAKRLKSEGSMDASRALELSIAGVVDVRILAGDAAKRKRAEALRKRWNAEARPLLALAGVASGAALEEARSTADASLREADELESAARHKEERAADHTAQASGAAKQERRVAELDAALEGCDRQALAGIVRKVGSAWESQTEKSERELEAQEIRAKKQRDEAGAELAGVSGRLAQLDEALAARRNDREKARAALGAEPAACLRDAAAELSRLDAKADALRSELEKLEGTATKAVADAKARLQDAERGLEDASGTVRGAEARAADARSLRDRASGERASLGRHAESLPRAEAEDRLRRAVAALGELGGDDVDEASARERAERLEADLAAARAELHKAEGALTQVRGGVVREEHEKVKAAHLEAEERQRHLELDAEAWKLLRDTLKESERVGSEHVGKALGSEVGRRFGELTSGRYQAVDIDPHLTARHVAASGGPRSIDALSVGTREQLATLLRLAIAENLGTAIILDDQLVQSDGARLEWFRAALHQAAALVQVVVLTCRCEDYVDGGGTSMTGVTCIDLGERIRRARTN